MHPRARASQDASGCHHLEAPKRIPRCHEGARIPGCLGAPRARAILSRQRGLSCPVASAAIQPRPHGLTHQPKARSVRKPWCTIVWTKTCNRRSCLHDHSHIAGHWRKLCEAPVLALHPSTQPSLVPPLLPCATGKHSAMVAFRSVGGDAAQLQRTCIASACR